jgi:glutamate 5-kinase
MSQESARAQSPEVPFDRKALFSNLRRIVVKVGTNVLTRDTGEMSLGRIHTLIEEIVDVHRRGLQVILVSSGAISMGMDRLGLKKKPGFLPEKQACAAVGQIRLMSVYEQAFERFGIAIAQVLLTEEDFTNRVRYLNLRNTMSRCLEYKVIPIVNENDTVSTSEIEVLAEDGSFTRKAIFGDNDRLSALVMSKLGADLLVLLSDVDGLYPIAADADDTEVHSTLSRCSSPGASPALEPLALVREITPEIEAMAREGNRRGRGGMLSKLQSIKVALEGGGIAVIASGTKSEILPRILAGENVGTLFLPKRRIASRKRWIAYATAPAGKVVVNGGAKEALVKRRSSLLFAGVVAIEADFKRGAVVSITDEEDVEFARGIANYSARDASPLVGKRSSEIAEISGKDYEEFITRDNIVVLESS